MSQQRRVISFKRLAWRLARAGCRGLLSRRRSSGARCSTWALLSKGDVEEFQRRSDRGAARPVLARGRYTAGVSANVGPWIDPADFHTVGVATNEAGEGKT